MIQRHQTTQPPDGGSQALRLQAEKDAHYAPSIRPEESKVDRPKDGLEGGASLETAGASRTYRVRGRVRVLMSARLFTARECAELVAEAEAHACTTGGWTTARCLPT